MKLSLSLALIIPLLLFTAADDIIVIIDHTAHLINSETSCTMSKWANTLENSCICCLIKHAPHIKEKNFKASYLINGCIGNKNCSKEVLNQLIQELIPNQQKLDVFDAKSENILRDFITHLYDKVVVIKEIYPTAITFTPEGNFTEESLKQFLEQAYKDKKLPNPDFKSVSCLQTHNIATSGGIRTRQLFTVQSSCSVPPGREYIVKDIERFTDPEGIQHPLINEPYFLVEKALMPELQPFIYPNKKENFPTLIFPEAYTFFNASCSGQACL